MTNERREFLISLLKMSGQLATANLAVYSVGLFTETGVGSLVAGAKCPAPGNFCRFLRGYPDGSNQLNWGYRTFGPEPACAPSDNVAGGARTIDCPPPYDDAPYF